MERRHFLLMFTFSLLVNTIHCEYADKEATLLDALRNDYRVDHRPNETTVITSSLEVFSLNHLDIGAETMSVTGLLVCVWVDPRLRWNASHYNGIEGIAVPKKYLWTPPLVIENVVKKVELVGSEGVPLRVWNTGIVGWVAPVSTTSTCSVDITYYPYDKQTCGLILTGWTYSVDEMNLIVDTKIPISYKHFSSNGEWELVGTNYELLNFTDETQTYRKVIFEMTFLRKWQFYGLNVIVPIVLNSLLMVMVFVVPLESGEKMGYCLTVLLSYIMLLTIVSEDLPSVSSQTSIIQIYLSIVMCIGTAGAVCTIGVLRLYNEDERNPVPGWLQTITMFILAPLTCKSCKSKRAVSPSSKNVTNQTQDDEEQHSHKDLTIQTQNDTEMHGFKEIAKMIDTIFFRLFAMVMLILTIVFIVLLSSHYFS